MSLNDHTTYVFNVKGEQIGWFDGRFVRDHAGQVLYWIEDNEIFSVPRNDDERSPGAHGAIKLGDIVKGAATTSDGDVFFTFSPAVVQ